MTPEQFKAEVNQIIKLYDDDLESKHSLLDQLMIRVLSQLGYAEGASAIESTEKWYA